MFSWFFNTQSKEKDCLLNKEEEKSEMKLSSSIKASTLDFRKIECDLSTNINFGLSTLEAKNRQLLYGLNEFDVGEDTPLWLKYLNQFKEPMILLLLTSGLVSICMGQYDDAISITVAVIIVVTVAFIQEYRSDKSVEAITQLVPPSCHCLRNGDWVNFLAKELVPGDIVAVETGDRVPADLRLFEAIHLEIDESSFTGEIKPARKCTLTLSTNSEKSNMALMGTLVRAGKGKGIVCGTGTNSEFGSVFQMMKDEEPPKTPLQKSMDQLGKQLSFYSILIIGLVVLLGWIQNRKIMEMFTIGVSLAVAAIPEGLPIVVTVTLALGVMRMANRNAIVKKLPAVETLGCATVVCSDKTGTLTKNEMTVTDIVLADNRRVKVTGIGYSSHGQILFGNHGASEFSDESLTLLVKTGCLCNNASIKNSVLFGQATEGAIIAVGLKLGLVRLNEEYERIDEMPFTSENKWMSVKCRKLFSEDAPMFYVKGSFEKVLEKCSTWLDYGVKKILTSAHKESAAVEASKLGYQGLRGKLESCQGYQGLRVVAFAYGEEMNSLTYLGIAGIIDPPREGVKDAICTLIEGGVNVKMLTGDARETAVAIASKVGLNTEAANVISGEQIDSMDSYELEKIINNITVFYRVSPKNKVTIVRALQRKDHVVAMTGDGVNDAIALKCADIGITMGKGGTDVSKEAADMILADDDFKTILIALAEGKGIYYNIRNFVRFQLSTSIAAITLITISTLLALPNPLNAMQILWINIIMDGPPAQSLGVEPVTDDVMRQKPRAVKDPMVNRYLLIQVLISSAIIVAGTLYIFWHEMSDSIITPRDTTMTFTCFVFFDMFNAMSCRSQTKSILEIGFFSNRMFLYAVGGSVIGQMLVIYFPPLQRVFQTESLTFYDIIKLTAIASSVLVVDEIRKLVLKNCMKKLLRKKSIYDLV